MDGRAAFGAFDVAITGRSTMSQPRLVFVIGRRDWNSAAGERRSCVCSRGERPNNDRVSETPAVMDVRVPRRL